MRKWYRLDSLAKYYTSNIHGEQKVFRYSAMLEDNIDKDILQQALDKTIYIYKNFNVNLKRGLFWYYFNESSDVVRVMEENLPICFNLYNSSEDFLYRVSYYKNKINLEVSHMLSDGRGTLGFFKSLLTNYVSLKYKIKIEEEQVGASWNEMTENSFQKYYKKVKRIKKEKDKTYIYKGKKYRNQTRFMECYMDATKLLNIAHSYNTSITALLTSMLIYSFKDVMKLSDMNKYIKIDIPVDLRGFYKSSSSQNFVGICSISYKFNSKDDTLEDVIRSVDNQFKTEITEEKINQKVNSLVAVENNPFCRFVPLFIKTRVISLGKKILVSNASTCLSNVGVIEMDNNIKQKIKTISAMISTEDFQFTICTFNNTLCLTISSAYVTNDIIKNYCRSFSNMGVDVTIYTNTLE